MKRNLTSIIAAAFIGLAMLACNAAAGTSPAGDSPAQPPVSGTSESAPAVESNPTESTPPSAGGACANPYIPVIIGASWNYQLVGSATDTYTHSIIAVDGASFTEQDVFGTGVKRQGKWNCDSGSLIALDPAGGSSANVNTGGMSVNFQTTAQSGVTFPANPAPGSTWSQSITLEGTQTINGTEIPSKNQTTTDCTAIGMESVTVTAGTFDALHVDCNVNMHLVITIQGSEMPTTLDMKSSSWYAPNVGMVKTVSTGSNLNSTVELISYTIP